MLAGSSIHGKVVIVLWSRTFLRFVSQWSLVTKCTSVSEDSYGVFLCIFVAWP